MKQKILVFIFLSSLSSISAASLYAPFPSIGVAEVKLDLRYHLIQKHKFELYTNVGVDIDWSLIPPVAVPSCSANVGIVGSMFFSDNLSGFNIRLGTMFSFYMNPFFYRSEFYEMDFLLASLTDLTLNYRFRLNNNCFLEPFIGGRLIFFGSVTEFNGIKPYISLVAGISFSINFAKS